MSTESWFHFTEINVSEMTKELSSLNSKIAETFGNIPTKVLQTSSDICNASKNMEFRNFRETVLPSKFKICWYNTCLKKDPKLAKTYKPVSILPTVSKVFEIIIQKQLLTHIERFLSPYVCRYRKGYSTQ